MILKQSKPKPDVIKDPRLVMVNRVAKLMDEEFSIGGFKFGLDPIINLIPVAGDLGSYIISIALIVTMFRHGASGKVVAKMLTNATLDALIGIVPFLGWGFDFFYKANTRNLKLLTQHYTEGKHQGNARQYLLLMLTVIILVLCLIIYVSVKALMWLIDSVWPLIFN